MDIQRFKSAPQREQYDHTVATKAEAEAAFGVALQQLGVLLLSLVISKINIYRPLIGMIRVLTWNSTERVEASKLIGRFNGIATEFARHIALEGGVDAPDQIDAEIAQAADDEADAAMAAEAAPARGRAARAARA